MDKFVTNSPDETQKIAAGFAARVLAAAPKKSATVLGLEGDLGAGKTTFLQGFAKALGITEVVNSPTFVMLKRFKIYDLRFKNFYHFDCYRRENPEEILGLGFKEIISNPENIVAIEWPEKIAAFLPKEIISIQFIHKNSTQRVLNISGLGI